MEKRRMGGDKGRMETEDIILGKAKYEDWSSIYRNVWSRPETAEHMAWKVTADEDGARERIQRTITWQKTHDAWLVYERGSGQAIGFAVRSRRQTSTVGKLINWRFIKKN
jgi:hypothetical protein